MTLHELIFEACQHLTAQWTALDYDTDMEAEIEAEFGALIDVFVDAGVVASYSIDAGTGYTTSAVTQFGQVKVMVELTDAKTGGTESRLITFGTAPVNARSHNT